MWIPVGLIGMLLSEAAEPDYGEVERRIDRQRAREAHRDAAAELEAACTGPDASLLYLGDNAWDLFSIDGQEIARPARRPTRPPAGYRTQARQLGPGPHGFFGLCAGRHVVSAFADGRAVERAFVVYPREIVALRLDVGRGAWLEADASEALAVRDAYGDGTLELLDYGESVARPRVVDGRARRGLDVLADVHGLATQAVAAALAGRLGPSRELAQRAAALLDAVPLSSFAPITSAFGFQVYELAAKSDLASARAVLDVALALLPDDATLLAVGGELAARAGRADDARRLLGAALAREAGLDEAWRQRAGAALATL